MTRPTQGEGHKSNHVAQSTFTPRRLISMGGFRPSRQGYSFVMHLLSPRAHPAIAIPTGGYPRKGRGRIFLFRRLPPYLRSFGQVVDAISIATLR